MRPALQDHFGPGWRVLYDPVPDTAVLLHESGLWAEMSGAWMDAGAGHAEVAATLDGAARLGMTGRVRVEVTREGKWLSARVVRP